MDNTKKKVTSYNILFDTINDLGAIQFILEDDTQVHLIANKTPAAISAISCILLNHEVVFDTKKQVFSAMSNNMSTSHFQDGGVFD